MAAGRRVYGMLGAGVALMLAGASAYGGFSSNEPGDPPIRITGCWHGFWPTLAFGPGLTFGAQNVVFGPDFYRTRMVAVSWPGGTLGAFIVPICPDDIPQRGPA